MTIGEFIRSKYRDWGVVCTDADLIFPGVCISPDDRLTSKNIIEVERALLGRIPELLLMPQSVSELGVSISRASREAIMTYYRYKCKELGVPDKLTERNTVRFL